MNTLYKEEIIEHYKDPQNFGKLAFFTISSHITNPFCGDEIEVYLEIQNKNVKDISFSGQGCVISIASASIVTEAIKNKNLTYVKNISDEEVIKLLEIEISNTRKKCALLAFSAIKDCIKEYENA